MTERTSWIREREERVHGQLPDGTLLMIVNEYRVWAPTHGPLEQSGCPNCGKRLYDRLTHIYYMRADGPNLEYHLNSGTDIEELRLLEATSWNGKKVYVRDGKVVTETVPTCSGN